MPFVWFVALRYLRDARGQTALILAAVSVGVSVIVFLSALINGLQDSLIESTLGSQAHVTLRVPREAPRPLAQPAAGLALARIVEPAPQRLRSIDGWPAVMDQALGAADVVAASPLVSGSGTAARAGARLPIVIRGVDPDRFRAIVDLRAAIVEGTDDLTGVNVLIGSTLAADLGVGPGDAIRIESTEDVADVVRVAGVFTLGSDAVDARWVVTSLRRAQSLFALPCQSPG